MWKMYLRREQQLLECRMAANPRRYFLLKNAYKHGLMHELLEPSHWAIGVIISSISSVELLNSGPVQWLQIVRRKTKHFIEYKENNRFIFSYFQIHFMYRMCVCIACVNTSKWWIRTVLHWKWLWARKRKTITTIYTMLSVHNHPRKTIYCNKSECTHTTHISIHHHEHWTF